MSFSPATTRTARSAISTFVITVNDESIGWIAGWEKLHPDYRHAGIDLFISTAHQGKGYGPEAIRLVCRFLFEERGHHRITIDPAADNVRAIRAYEKVGFKRVGVMRRYERGADGSPCTPEPLSRRKTGRSERALSSSGRRIGREGRNLRRQEGVSLQRLRGGMRVRYARPSTVAHTTTRLASTSRSRGRGMRPDAYRKKYRSEGNEGDVRVTSGYC